jgi:hypothetical protein
MPANTTPIFPASPNIGLVQISTGNTNRDGTGTIATAFTPGTNGSRIERAYIQATATTTAGMIRVYLNDGTNTRLISEIPVSAVTPSATVQAYHADIPLLEGMVVPSGYTVRVSTEKSEVFNITVEGGNY